MHPDSVAVEGAERKALTSILIPEQHFAVNVLQLLYVRENHSYGSIRKSSTFTHTA